MGADVAKQVGQRSWHAVHAAWITAAINSKGVTHLIEVGHMLDFKFVVGTGCVLTCDYISCSGAGKCGGHKGESQCSWLHDEKSPKAKGRISTSKHTGGLLRLREDPHNLSHPV